MVLVGFGSLSVWPHNPDILIIADTLYYGSAALALGGLLLSGYNLMERLFSPTFGMTARGWTILTWRWVTVLALASLLNELVRQFGTPQLWLTVSALADSGACSLCDNTTVSQSPVPNP